MMTDFKKPFNKELDHNNNNKCINDDEEEFFHLYLSEDDEDDDEYELISMLKTALEKGKLPPKLRFKRNLKQEVKKMIVKYEYLGPAS